MSGLGPQIVTLGPTTAESAPTSPCTGTGTWLAGNPAPCLALPLLALPLGLLPTQTTLGFLLGSRNPQGRDQAAVSHGWCQDVELPSQGCLLIPGILKASTLGSCCHSLLKDLFVPSLPVWNNISCVCITAFPAPSLQSGPFLSIHFPLWCCLISLLLLP